MTEIALTESGYMFYCPTCEVIFINSDGRCPYCGRQIYSEVRNQAAVNLICLWRKGDKHEQQEMYQCLTLDEGISI